MRRYNSLIPPCGEHIFKYYIIAKNIYVYFREVLSTEQRKKNVYFIIIYNNIIQFFNPVRRILLAEQRKNICIF